MELRQASMDDAYDVIQLIQIAIGDLAEKYTGYQDDELIKEALANLYESEPSRFYHEFIYVIEEQERIIGEITLYPADELLTLNQGFEQHLLEAKNSNVLMTEDYINEVLMTEAADEGEFYIDSLAVAPDYQGKGYGKKLLSYAERVAQIKGYAKLSLLADVNNHHAIHIYKRMGFEVESTKRLLGHDFLKMIKVTM